MFFEAKAKYTELFPPIVAPAVVPKVSYDPHATKANIRLPKLELKYLMEIISRGKPLLIFSTV